MELLLYLTGLKDARIYSVADHLILIKRRQQNKPTLGSKTRSLVWTKWCRIV